MLATAEISQLEEECKKLPPTRDWQRDDYIVNLFLTVLDYQNRVKTVHKALDYYKNHCYKEIRNHNHLENLLAQYPDTKEGNLKIAQYLWGNNHWTRLSLLRRFVAFFDKRGICDEESLEQWTEKATFEEDFKGQVKGAGLQIFQWLRMRTGQPTIKPDTHIRRFVEQIINRTVSDEEIIDGLEEVAKRMGVLAHLLDSRIWTKMSGYDNSPPPL